MRKERLVPRNRLVILAALSALLATECGSTPAGENDWSRYGAALGGDRYATPSAITPEGDHSYRQLGSPLEPRGW